MSAPRVACSIAGRALERSAGGIGGPDNIAREIAHVAGGQPPLV